MLKLFLHDQRGATAVEYGILATVLSMVIIGGVGFALGAVGDLFGHTDSAITQNLKIN